MWHLCGGARKPVQKSIAQLIATIAKHDLPDNRWPALFQFLEQYVRSDSAVDREVHLQISVILSLLHFEMNFGRKWNKTCHLPFSLLL